ncbi:DUF6056 family protein [Ruminococcus flavefaciens]|uniref:DUF6056 family protein n=1 Tax=Ruminococcus flavefaciens TaxID=1265 RepID=UPI00048E50F3|nr:DUF6056 family protein [Ruminococcus flavefaciens]
MDKAASRKNTYIYILIFSVFIIVHCLCLIKTSDDLMWDNIDSLSQMLKSCNPNGRYFTNIITYFICNSPVLCFFVYTFCMGAFLYLFGELLKADLKHKWLAFVFAGCTFLFAPRYFFVHIFNWISGFTNYVISLVFLFLYFRHCLPLFEKKPLNKNKFLPFLFLITGFLGELCIENITAYDLIFGVFIIIFSFVTQKKVYLSNITYLLGTVAGTVVMMSDSNYKHIANEGDSFAFRSFISSPSDIYMKIYREIIPDFSRPYYLLHIIIASCILCLFVRKYGKKEKRPKYALLSLIIIVFYAVFSFVVSNGEEMAVLSNAYRSRAIEAALTFAYIAALIYMICILFEGGRRIRTVVYLLSTVFVTAPFIVVNAITGRCFFASFVFWCLFTFELAVPVMNDVKFFETSFSVICGAILISSVLGMNMFMDISNKVVDIIRINYIHEQLEADERQIQLIKLPYQKNCFDPITLFSENDLFLTKDGKRYSYTELYCINNDIDEKIFDKQTMYIDMIDYNMSKEDY